MRIAVVDYHKGNLKSVERGLTAAGADVFITDDVASLARADALVLPGVGAFADASASMCALGQMDAIRARVAAGVPFLGICLGLHLMFEEGVEGSPQEDDEQSTHNAPGLAILPGVVGALPRVDVRGVSYKVPHVGWNSIDATRQVGQSIEDPSRGISHSGVTHSVCVSDRGVFESATSEPKCAAVPTKRVSQRSEDCLSDWVLPRTSVDQVGFGSPLLEGIQPGEFFYFTHGYVAPDSLCTVATTTHSVAFPSVVAYKNAFGVQFHPEKSSDAGAVLLRNFVNIVREG